MVAVCRTLTPFGFQAEERTLWEATETYIKMSPYLQANKIKKPLLLIHGEDDNNTGKLLKVSNGKLLHMLRMLSSMVGCLPVLGFILAQNWQRSWQLLLLQPQLLDSQVQCLILLWASWDML